MDWSLVQRLSYEFEQFGTSTNTTCLLLGRKEWKEPSEWRLLESFRSQKVVSEQNGPHYLIEHEKLVGARNCVITFQHSLLGHFRSLLRLSWVNSVGKACEWELVACGTPIQTILPVMFS